MKNWINRSFLMAALVACVAVAVAQDNGGQQRRGGGQRGGGFGQRGFGGQMGRGGNELSLAMRKDVQTDLGVTADQKTKLEALNTKQREARRALGGGGGRRNGGNGGATGTGTTGGNGGAGGQGTFNREEMQKRMEDQRAQTRKDLAAILNETQMQRLDEISLQLRGPGVYGDPEVQKKLGFTSEQTQKIKDLQQKMQEANRSLVQKMRDGVSREEVTKSLEANNKAFETEAAKVLTAEQSDKLKAMQGKPFKADPNEAQGRRGGGGL